eukprot:SAG22_NODE_79_length_21845_cov_17.798538_1_plen_121_part_00
MLLPAHRRARMGPAAGPAAVPAQRDHFGLSRGGLAAALVTVARETGSVDAETPSLTHPSPGKRMALGPSQQSTRAFVGCHPSDAVVLLGLHKDPKSVQLYDKMKNMNSVHNNNSTKFSTT